MDRQPVRLALRSVPELCRRAARASFDGDLNLREHDGTEHRVVFRRGVVVDVRLSGRFDPILRRLLDEGALTTTQFVRALESLGRSQRRSGEMARELGVARETVRAALRVQGQRRFRALLTLARDRGRDAWLSPRQVHPRQVAFRLDVGALLKLPREEGAGDGRAPTCRRAPRVPGRNRRRALRRLAFALHPDRHPDLSDAEREELGRRLAEATAKFHRL